MKKVNLKTCFFVTGILLFLFTVLFLCENDFFFGITSFLSGIVSLIAGFKIPNYYDT